MDSAITKHFHSNDAEFAAAFDVKSKLLDDSSSLLVLPFPEQNQSNTVPHFSSNSQTKDLERGVPPEDLYFYYNDPHGKTQGPFLGADIILWFEEGYFGTELPVRLADAPDGTPFQNLGEVMPHLKLKGAYPSSEQEKADDSGGKLESSLPLASIPEITDSSTVNDMCQPLSEFNLSTQHTQSRLPEPEPPLQLPHSEGQSFHDFVEQDEGLFLCLNIFMDSAFSCPNKAAFIYSPF